MFINLKDMHEDCVEQLKSRHVYLNEDTKRGWHCKDGSHTNLLIEGENYHALRMLEYTHTGKVDVIYIIRHTTLATRISSTRMIFPTFLMAMKETLILVHWHMLIQRTHAVIASGHRSCCGD